MSFRLKHIAFVRQYLNQFHSVVLQEWSATYYKASTALQNREKKLEEAAELIEMNFTLIGASAIEDKLQDVRRNPCYHLPISSEQLHPHLPKSNPYNLILKLSISPVSYHWKDSLNL